MFAVMVFAAAATAATPPPSAQQFEPGTVNIVRSVDRNGCETCDTIVVPESAEQIAAKAAFTKSAVNHRLKVNLTSNQDADGSPIGLSVVYVIKDELVSWFDLGGKNPSFNLPEGKYLLQVNFKGGGNATIFMPDVELKGDTTIDVNVTMADKKVFAALTLPSGKPAVLGDTELTPNISMLRANFAPFYKGVGKIRYQLNLVSGGDDYYKDLQMRSNLDADGTYFWNLETNVYPEEGKESAIGLFIARQGDKVADGEICRNSVSDYSKVDVRFQPLPGQTNTDYVAYSYSDFTPDGSGPFYTAVTGMHATADFYLGTPVWDTAAYRGYCRISSAIAPLAYIESTIGKIGIASPAIARAADGLQYVCSNATSPYRFSRAELSHDRVNPWFGFAKTDAQVLGSSAPYCVTVDSCDMAKNRPHKLVVNSYLGNFGEERVADLAKAMVKVEHNGVTEEFADHTAYAKWADTFGADGHQKGKVAITFTDVNARVDSLPARNVCTLEYDETLEDRTPPTLQRVMLRGTDGQPTFKFDHPEDGTLTLAGGDFTLQSYLRQVGFIKNYIYYYTWSTAEVKAEYAPNGTDSFAELPVSVDSARYVESWGAYWSGSLASVNRQSSNGWFDLRLTLTDPSGNRQTQLISPAFYVHSLNSVRGIEAVADTFYMADGRIVSAIGAEVEVFALTGARVRNDRLAKGVYIARANGRTAKVLVK